MKAVRPLQAPSIDIEKRNGHKPEGNGEHQLRTKSKLELLRADKSLSAQVLIDGLRLFLLRERPIFLRRLGFLQAKWEENTHFSPYGREEAEQFLLLRELHLRANFEKCDDPAFRPHQIKDFAESAEFSRMIFPLLPRQFQLILSLGDLQRAFDRWCEEIRSILESGGGAASLGDLGTFVGLRRSYLQPDFSGLDIHFLVRSPLLKQTKGSKRVRLRNAESFEQLLTAKYGKPLYQEELKTPYDTELDSSLLFFRPTKKEAETFVASSYFQLRDSSNCEFVLRFPQSSSQLASSVSFPDWARALFQMIYSNTDSLKVGEKVLLPIGGEISFLMDDSSVAGLYLDPEPLCLQGIATSEGRVPVFRVTTVTEEEYSFAERHTLELLARSLEVRGLLGQCQFRRRSIVF